MARGSPAPPGRYRAKKKAGRAALDRISNEPRTLLRGMDESEEVEPESYQNLAIVEWLPRRGDSATHEQALTALAERFEARHEDRWLRDVLATQPDERTRQGWTALSEAVQANLTDESDTALAKGADAAAQLRAAGDAAGARRAELKQTNALEGSWRPVKCLEKEATGGRRPKRMGNSWIPGQR